MEKETVSVLNASQIQRKIERIAHQIIEFNYEEERIVLVGIAGQGWILTERLCQLIRQHSEIEVHCVQLKMDKRNPISGDYQWSGGEQSIENQSVILIDDVLNSGRTLIYATCAVLRFPVKKLTTVALVDRRHRKFPIKADFVGLTLSTTLQEHITVELEPGQEKAYLE
jgi:pyrimidine operon attenuation protein/uracil phosphoribosyltransferase